MPTLSSSTPAHLTVALAHAQTRLEVVFQKRHDRYAHAVRVAANAANPRHWVTLLESLEGTPDQPWPTSPPLQACQTIGEAGVLATGMAGASHWSLAVTATGSRLIWDVACRFRHSPDQLASAYQVLLAGTAGPDNSLLWTISKSGNFQLALRCCPAAQTRCQLQLEPNRLVVQPTLPPPPPATARWKYQLDIISR